MRFRFGSPSFSSLLAIMYLSCPILAKAQGITTERDLKKPRSSPAPLQLAQPPIPTGAVLFVIPEASPADVPAPVTSLHMTSDEGDYIGGGREYFYTPADGSFYISGGPNSVSINFNSGDHWWYLDFAAPNGQSLAVGTYSGATRYPFQAASDPGLSIYGDGRGCNQLKGTFQIKQIAFGPGNTITAFWATFEQHCEGFAPALRGDIRFNATILVDITAPSSVSTQRGNHVEFLVSAASYDSTRVVLTSTELPTGATFEDNGNSTGLFSWTPLVDQTGEYIVTFQGENEVGDIDSTSTIVTVTGLTSLAMHSEPGDYIGAGLDYFYTPEDGNFYANTNYDNGASLRFDSGGFAYWYLDFAAAHNAPLMVGVYEGATRFPFQADNEPGLDVTGSGRGCNQLTGRFLVKQVEYGADNSTIVAFWAKFEQHCEGGSPALFGEIRYNADVLIDLTAPAALSVDKGQNIHFDVSAISYAGHDITLNASGLPSGASFTTHGDNSGTFDWTPGVVPSGVYEITFTADDGHGASEQALTQIHVTGVTSLVVNSEPLDFVGQGQSVFLSPQDGTFHGSVGQNGAVAIGFEPPLYYQDRWTLTFEAPNGAPLSVGNYVNAGLYPNQIVGSPGMSISNDGRSCYTPNDFNGSFTVKQAVYDENGGIQSLWVLFNQRCSNGGPGLQGEIRYNADVPLILSAPRTTSVAEAGSLTFLVTAYGETGKVFDLFALHLPSGATFEDHGDNTGTFHWQPDYDQAGNHQVEFGADDGLGIIDSTSVVIVVANTNRPPVASAGGPYQSNVGESLMFDGSASTDPDGDFMTWFWNFGDGGHGTGSQPSHTYTQEGEFHVVLTVSDGLLVSQSQATVTVQALVPVLLSSFQASPQPGAVLLEWATSAENDFSGFLIHRSLHPEEGYANVGPAIILAGSLYQFLDTEVIPGQTYYYRLEALDRSGEHQEFGPVSAQAGPIRTLLGWNHPNPFSGSTTRIPFALAQGEEMRIRILDVAGREVRMLQDQWLPAGNHEVWWDGRNSRGELVPAGFYLYELVASQYRATRRLIRLR